MEDMSVLTKFKDYFKSVFISSTIDVDLDMDKLEVGDRYIGTIDNDQKNQVIIITESC